MAYQSLDDESFVKDAVEYLKNKEAQSTSSQTKNKNENKITEPFHGSTQKVIAKLDEAGINFRNMFPQSDENSGNSHTQEINFDRRRRDEKKTIDRGDYSRWFTPAKIARLITYYERLKPTPSIRK